LFDGISRFFKCPEKPLDHSVYDGWQSIGERLLSNDGKYIAFTVNPQEGDGNLIVQSVNGAYKKEFARGYGAEFTQDSKYLVFKIKPSFKETRDAKIKKKKPEDLPKDSLAYLELGLENLVKVPRVKSFKMPEENSKWLVWLAEKPSAESAKPKAELDSLAKINAMLRISDSLMRAADSIRIKANDAKLNGLSVLQSAKKDAKTAKAPEEPFEEGTELIIRNQQTGEQKLIQLVTEYYFNKKGTVLVYETSKKTNDSLIKPTVVKLDLQNNKEQIVLRNFNDAKGYRLDEAGTQLAFVAERDSSAKALQKFYKLYYFKEGADSAKLIADRNTKGLPSNFTVSDNPNIVFSKSGTKLFLVLHPYCLQKTHRFQNLKGFLLTYGIIKTITCNPCS